MTNLTTTDIIAIRGETHGDYSTTAFIIQSLKSIMQDTANWAILNSTQKESLEMIAHKMGRILSGDPNFRDHWADIAGYAQLQADRSHEQ